MRCGLLNFAIANDLDPMTLAVWLSGNALVSINVVTLRRARLVLGWVCNHPPNPGQLSLTTPPRVGAMSTSLGWEGNSIGLASHWPWVTDNSGLSTYVLNGLWKGDEHPAYASLEYGRSLPLPLMTLIDLRGHFSYFDMEISVAYFCGYW